MRYKAAYSTHQPIRADMLLYISYQELTLTNLDVSCMLISLPLGAVVGFPAFGNGDSVFLLRVPNSSL